MVEEIHRRDAGETSGSSFVLILETKGRVMTKIQIGVDQNLEFPIKTEVNLDLANKYSVGTVAKLATLGGTAKVLRRRMRMILIMLLSA